MKTIIKVKKIEDTIKDITPQGIWYITSHGENIFINFEECYLNYLNYFGGDIKQDLGVKRVGQRDIINQYIEIFTMPITRFEFDNVDDCHQLRHRIRRCRWETMDLT